VSIALNEIGESDEFPAVHPLHNYQFLTTW